MALFPSSRATVSIGRNELVSEICFVGGVSRTAWQEASSKHKKVRKCAKRCVDAWRYLKRYKDVQSLVKRLEDVNSSVFSWHNLTQPGTFVLGNPGTILSILVPLYIAWSFPGRVITYAVCRNLLAPLIPARLQNLHSCAAHYRRHSRRRLHTLTSRIVLCL